MNLLQSGKLELPFSIQSNHLHFETFDWMKLMSNNVDILVEDEHKTFIEVQQLRIVQ